jgi:hypothetical protein
MRTVLGIEEDCESQEIPTSLYGEKSNGLKGILSRDFLPLVFFKKGALGPGRSPIALKSRGKPI